MAQVDLHVPHGDGTELVGELREARPGVSMLILTADLEPDLRGQMKKAGTGRVPDKLDPPGEIIGAIRRLGGG